MASSCSSNLARDGSCVTEMDKINVSFLWTLNEFSSIIKEAGESLCSLEFFPKGKRNPRFSLVLYPKGGREENKDHVGIFLKVLDDAQPPIDVNMKISLLDAKGDRKNTRSAKKMFTYDKNTWGFSDFVLRDFLLSHPHLLPNNNLNVLCEVSIQGLPKCKLKRNWVEVPDCDIIDNLEALQQSQSLSDVVLCSSGSEFPAHKALLSARSPVFKAMFEHNLAEAKRNRVDIEDLKSYVVEAMLQYIYTGRCSNLEEYAMELIAAADKYDLNRLKALCEDVLCRGIMVGNAAETLIVADMHNADQLREEALSFINKHAAEVMKTPEWKSLSVSKPYLVEDVLRSFLP